MARILVVDDAAFMRQNLVRVLTSAGHEIAGEAVNGEDAIEKFKSLQPDLITLDITMPVMDGLEALQKIRALDPDCRIVMCSAMSQEAMVVEAIKRGAMEFVVKPFRDDRVTQAVAASLR
jgi:two-component system chemotaxis response regulator CheY